VRGESLFGSRQSAVGSRQSAVGTVVVVVLLVGQRTFLSTFFFEQILLFMDIFPGVQALPRVQINHGGMEGTEVHGGFVSAATLRESLI
jgi:hypothetical protein